MKLRDMKLNKSVKKVYNEHKKEIDDIILFGSYMKGKENPKDIDIIIIFKSKVDKFIESEIKRLIDISEIDINSTTLIELEGEGFIAKEGIYLEGKSLITGKKISESMGFVSVAFIKYDISKIKGSERIRFYYALQGRGENNGFLSEVGARRYAESVIICEYDIIEKIKSFFDQWNLGYQIVPSLIPKRLMNILLR